MNLSNLFSRKGKTKENANEVDGDQIERVVGNGSGTMLEPDDEMKILILDGDEEPGEGEIGCGKAQEKIRFDEQLFKVCAECSEDVDCTKYSKKMLDDYKLLAIYVKEFEYDKAFYVKKDSIVVFENFKGNVRVKELELGGYSPADVAESYFGGQSNNEIDETISEIKDKYTKESKTALYAMLLLLALLGALVYFFVLSDDVEVKKVKPPRPNFPPLTMMEKDQIRRSLSLQVIGAIEKEIEKYKSNKALYNERRIRDFSLGNEIVLSPVIPVYSEELNVWEWPPGPKRGAIQYSVAKTTESIYPGVGYVLAQEDLYVKDFRKILVLDEVYLSKNPSSLAGIKLTKKCVAKMLNLPGEVVLYKRADRTIEARISKVEPSQVISSVKPLIEECPVVFKRINTRQGVIGMTLELYRVHKPKEETTIYDEN